VLDAPSFGGDRALLQARILTAMSPAWRTTFVSGLLAAGVSVLLAAQAAGSGTTTTGLQPPAGGAQTAAKGGVPADGSSSVGSNGGQQTSSPHPLQLDAQHRPITEGGFVKNGPVIFEDVSEKAGLTSWTHKMGGPAKEFIVETKGSGVGLIDYDNDGWLDIYIVNGSTFNALDGKETPPHAALFHNNHDGTFTDVAAKAGVTNDRWGFGVAIGDYDNDGWPDIYVSNWGKNRLYHNNHDGTFTDIADKAGVALNDPMGWHTGVTWGDYDGDGRLDLFVAGYLHYDRKNLPTPAESGGTNAFCTFRGEQVSCGPRGLKGEPDHLFHNNGDGTFTDVSEKSGMWTAVGTYGLSVAASDLDNDGWPDIYVANDSAPATLYLNQKDGTFRDIAIEAGAALSAEAKPQAGMGVSIGDYNRDGNLDVVKTNFAGDTDSLYTNLGDANFEDRTYPSGLGVNTRLLGWGVGFFDMDNDGWLDILMSNGHVYPEVDKSNADLKYAEHKYLYRNLRNGRFEEVTNEGGPGILENAPARGTAFGDYDNDGVIDVAVNCVNALPQLLRCQSTLNRNWIRF
jgi:enediyne biosynthesis protein E4